MGVEFRKMVTNTNAKALPSPSLYQLAAHLRKMLPDDHPPFENRRDESPHPAVTKLPLPTSANGGEPSVGDILRHHHSFVLHPKPPASYLFIYTDGSVSASGQSGAGWTLMDTTHPDMFDIGLGEAHSGMCRLGATASIFDAEAHAAQEALAWCCEQEHFPYDTITICMDSTSAMDNIVDGNPQNYEFARHALTNIQLLQGRGVKTRFLWTKAHIGIGGNERADELAKRGSSTLTPLCKHARTTTAYLRHRNSTFMMDEWKASRGDLPWYALPEKLAIDPSLSALGPGTATALMRIRANNTQVDNPPWVPDEDKPSCACDGVTVRSTAHLMAHCPLLREAREEAFGDPAHEDNEDFVMDPHSTDRDTVLQYGAFIRRTGLGLHKNVRDRRYTDRYEDVDVEVGLPDAGRIPDIGGLSLRRGDAM